MSMAASEMKSRAMPKSPTRAMASAAGASGRLVDSVGMIIAASSMQPNTMYGVRRKIGRGVVRDDGLLPEELVQRAERHRERRRATVLQPRAALVHPAHEQRPAGERHGHGEELGDDAFEVHAWVRSSSVTRVRKL